MPIYEEEYDDNPTVIFIPAWVNNALFFTFLVPVVLQNIYAFARFVNIARAVLSTGCFNGRRRPSKGGFLMEGDEPHVTIQVCAYNEETVIEATIDAACSVKWPRERLTVQILDDSTDKSARCKAEKRVAFWQMQGVNCQHLTRPNRKGYKAGNLKHHMDSIDGDFVAFFDADHLCDPDFLYATVPHFFDHCGQKQEIGLVQTPWAYYNTHQNLLTECDALSMDIHHVLEQQGRANRLRCFGFNGSGGIWRLHAIQAAGGFSFDTVTKDLDLSYTAFLAGYRFVYVPDLPQLLKLPSNILAYKQQKTRWNKGYLQVCRKSLWRIIKCKHLPLSIRIEAFFHSTNPITCFLGLVLLFLSPIMVAVNDVMTPALIIGSFLPCTTTIISGVIACYVKVPGPNGHYSTFRDRTKRLVYIPLVLCLAAGTCMYDTYAIFQGIFSNDSTFHRTPKSGGNETEFGLFEGHPPSPQEQQTWCANGLCQELYFIVCGITFSAYLMIVPCLDIFIWKWDPGMPFYAVLLRIGFVVPAMAVAVYHGRVFIELDKSFKMSSSPKSNKIVQQKIMRRGGFRAVAWFVVTIYFYLLTSTLLVYAPMMKEARLSQWIQVSNEGIVVPIADVKQNAEYTEVRLKDEDRDIRLPRIILAGVQKSGSTAIASFFRRAGVCFPRPNPREPPQKSAHFFDKLDLYNQGAHVYSDMFTHCENLMLAMDATPNTFNHPIRVRDTYDLVEGASEELKIVIVVREPVERELSWYNHLANKCHGNYHCGYENMFKQKKSEMYLRTFSEYAEFEFGDFNWTLEELPAWKRALLTGLYGEVVAKWLRYFDRKQILILSYSEMKLNEKSFLQRAISFLELEVNSTLIEHGTEKRNEQNSASKVELPPCDVQERLSKAFIPSNAKFFRMMEYGDEGPPMEQRPFPLFVLSNCTRTIEPNQERVSDVVASPNFLSFDLGGSGLKFLVLSVVEDDSSSSEGNAKLATPIGVEVNLGRIPENSDPKDWIQELIFDHLSFKSMEDWPQFGLAGTDNTYKLFGKSSYDAIVKLTRNVNNIDIGCEEISSDVPSWAKGITVWCKKWRPAGQVLGFSDDTITAFRGSFTDGRAHFEGARARLERIFTTHLEASNPFVIASWGLGTGHAVVWTRDRMKRGERYHPAKYQTASYAPMVLSVGEVAPVLSVKPVRHIHKILVDIPPSVTAKNITLTIRGHRQTINEPLPLWMILDGSIWSNPGISKDDVQKIYKSFFRQVLKAINSRNIPKPTVIVFSGGVQEHFGIAQMLRGMMEKQGIKTLGGFRSASHCGIVRLSYPNSPVKCVMKP